MPRVAPLLVTTSRSLLLIDGISGTGFRIDSGRGLYYGLATAYGSIYVAARNRLVSSPVPREQERGEILVFDARLEPRSILSAPFPLRDIHQVLIHDDKLWITCAFDNMVAIFDGRAWKQWHPCGQPTAEPADTNHFNSLSIFGNELCVVAHNLGPSQLLFFDLPDLRPTRSLSLGQASHNAWKHGTELMICSSDQGCLLGSEGTRVETGGFPRGYAHVGNETYVGISERAERNERDFSNAKIAAFSREWLERRSITLPEEGMVLDMMVVEPETWRHVQASGAWDMIRFPLLNAN